MLLAEVLGSKSTGSGKLQPVGSMRRNREIANVATRIIGAIRAVIGYLIKLNVSVCSQSMRVVT